VFVHIETKKLQFYIQHILREITTMKNKLTIALSIPLIATGLSISAFAYDGAEYAKQAKVTMAQARANVEQATHGKIKESELEKVKGHLVYSFDVETEKGLREVTVSAEDGEITSNESASFLDRAANVLHDNDEDE